MPKRPIQHEIDELAQRIFNDALPPSWIVNPFTRDYCKDFFVEIVNQEEVTGDVFVIQLKGKKSTKATRRAPSTMSVRVERDHLSYYLDTLPLPVFLVAVDVNTREACFEFVQRTIDPQKLKAPGKGRAVSFRVRKSNRLNDTAKLKQEVQLAWEYMREKYPGSVAAAADYRRRALKQLDPRFDYVVTVVDGKEHITLHAKGPVDCKLSIAGDKEAVRAKVAAFLDHGKPITADTDIKITVEGSPIFAAAGGSVTAVSHTPLRPVEVVISAITAKHGCASLPEYRGNMGGGFKHQSFEGTLAHCPLAIHLAVEPSQDGRGVSHLSWRWEPDAWTGCRLILLPWLDAVKQFLLSISEPDARIRVQVKTLGTQILQLNSPAAADMRQLADCAVFAETLSHARHVCRTLELDPVVPDDFTEQDFQDIEELYALVTTGRYKHPGTFEFTCGLEMEGSEAEHSYSGGKFLIHSGDSTYSFLGTKFPFGECLMELSDWSDVGVGDYPPDARNGKELVQLRLSRCTKTMVWPRFVEKPARDNED